MGGMNYIGLLGYTGSSCMSRAEQIYNNKLLVSPQLDFLVHQRLHMVKSSAAVKHCWND